MQNHHLVIDRPSESRGGNVVVFLPGAPNPWSGSVVYVSEDRVESLDMAPIDAVKNIRVLGRGSAKLASSGL